MALRLDNGFQPEMSFPLNQNYTVTMNALFMSIEHFTQLIIEPIHK